MSKHYNVIEHVTKDHPPEMAFNIGNAIKYLARAPHKGSYEADLYKAEDFLHHARTGKWLHEEGESNANT